MGQNNVKGENKMKNSKVMWLCEGAIMVAIATVLSMIPIINMPYGGSVTAVSMLPIIIFAYRYGVGKGLTVGLVYAVIQLMLGVSNLSYATSFGAAVAIVLLDYISAFTILGFSGLLRDKFGGQTGELTVGTVAVCIIRYICHVITGCTVWAGVSIPTSDGLVYSLGYNAAYMVPETVVTAAAVWYLARILNLKTQMPTRLKRQDDKTVGALGAVSLLLVVATVVFDAVMVFFSIQTEDGFDITAIANIDLKTVLIVTAIGIISAVSLNIFAKLRGKSLKN